MSRHLWSNGLQTSRALIKLQVAPRSLGSPLTAAVNCCVPPDGTNVVADGEMEIVMSERVIVADAETAESVKEVAVRVTVRSAMADEVGAVKVLGIPLAVDVGEALPHGAAEHDTVQMTPLRAPSFVTVAETEACAPNGTLAEVSESAIVMAGTVTVTVLDFDTSLTEVAVTLTVRLPCCDAGGVYVVGAPLAVDVGETLPQAAAEQATVQSTPSWAESFATVAVNCEVVPSSTVAVVLESMTLIGGGGDDGVDPPQPAAPKAMTEPSSSRGSDKPFSDLMAILSA